MPPATSINVTPPDPASGAAGEASQPILVQPDGALTTVVAPAGGTTLNFTDTGLPTGTAQTYKLRATGADGTVEYSAPFTVSTLDPPSGYGIVQLGHSIAAGINSTPTAGVGGQRYPNAYSFLAWSFLDPSVLYANVAVGGDKIQDQIDRFDDAGGAGEILTARSNLLVNAAAIRLGINDFRASVSLAVMKTKLLELVNLCFGAGANRVYVETESPGGTPGGVPSDADWEAVREGTGSFNAYIRALPDVDNRIVVIDTGNPATTMGTFGAPHNDTVHWTGPGDDTHPVNAGMLLYAYIVGGAWKTGGFPARTVSTLTPISASFIDTPNTLLAEYAPQAGCHFYCPRGAGFKVASDGQGMVCHTQPAPVTDGAGVWGVSVLGGTGNITVQADMFFTGNISQGPALLVGVDPTKFSEAQQGDGYAFYYTGEGDRHIWMIRYIDGQNTQLWQGAVPSGSGWHNFRVVRNGANFKVYVDLSGTPALDVTDPSPLAMNLGCGIMGFLDTTPIKNFSAQ